MSACLCIGPQNGEPRCPCEMRNESAKDMELRLLCALVATLEKGQGRKRPFGNANRDINEHVTGTVQTPGPIWC